MNDFITTHLLNDAFIRQSGVCLKRKRYKLMSKDYVALCYISENKLKELLEINVIKQHKTIWIVSRRGIQRLNGNADIKKTYKSQL